MVDGQNRAIKLGADAIQGGYKGGHVLGAVLVAGAEVTGKGVHDDQPRRAMDSGQLVKGRDSLLQRCVVEESNGRFRHEERNAGLVNVVFQDPCLDALGDARMTLAADVEHGTRFAHELAVPRLAGRQAKPHVQGQKGFHGPRRTEQNGKGRLFQIVLDQPFRRPGFFKDFVQGQEAEATRRGVVRISGKRHGRWSG